MRTIYKYQFQPNDFLELKLPVGSKILTVQTQHDIPCMWVEQDTKLEKYSQRFAIVGTGHPLDRMYDYGVPEYVGTFQLHEGKLVFHLYKLN